MKFRYTFEKDFQKRVIIIDISVISFYQKFKDKGHKVAKCEAWDSKAEKWIVVI